MISTKNHLDPSSKNKRLNSLARSAKSENEILILPVFELGCCYKDIFMVYTGLFYEDEPEAVFGTRYRMSHGSEFDFSVFFGFPDNAWENPFLTGIKRKTTNVLNYGGKFTYQFFNWEIHYEAEFTDVDRDKIGQCISRLKRDGVVHLFTTSYELELGYGFELAPVIEFSLGAVKGKSNRYIGYSGGVELEKKWSTFELETSVIVGVNNYDSRHPIFSKIRKDNTFEASAVLTWLDPIGYDNFFLRLGGRYEYNDSNIHFYDSSEAMSFLSIGFRFGENAVGNY